MLVDTHAQFVYNLALRLVRNPQEAEDLSQEAFVRAWQAMPRFRADARFRTWLYRIVTNLCYDKLPRLRRELSLLDPDDTLDLPSGNKSPEGQLLTKEMEKALHSKIDELPESYRLLITLRHLQEMTYAEIAEVTGQPLGTVKTGIFRARRLLREEIEKYEND